MSEVLLKEEINIVNVKEHRIDVTQFPSAFLDIAYGRESENQKMDLFLPEGPGPFPVIVIIHGGAWKYGSRRSHRLQGMFKAVSQGYAVASIDYRFSNESKWPAQMIDGKKAIAFLRKFGKKYGLDTEYIICWGNSVGAYIANMMGAANDMKEYPDSKIQGIISWYGISDIYECVKQNRKKQDLHIDEVMGYVVSDYPKIQSASASVIEYINKDYPHILIQAGTGDNIVPCEQSVALYETVNFMCGEGRAQIDIFEDAGHGDPIFKEDANINRCLDFADWLTGIDREKNPRTPLPKILWKENK